MKKSRSVDIDVNIHHLKSRLGETETVQVPFCCLDCELNCELNWLNTELANFSACLKALIL